MPQLGPAELLVVLVVALVVFGPKRLPEVGRQVGRGLQELRKIQDTVRSEINDVLHAPDPLSAPPPSDATTDAPTYRSSGTAPAATGRPAPSRFRPAPSPDPPRRAVAAAGFAASTSAGATPADPAPRATSVDSGATKRAGSQAPSRFRAPGA